MYKRILIPTDGSVCSDYAVKEGLKLADTFGANVTFLYVLENPLTGYYAVPDGAAYYANIDQDMRRYAEETLRNTRQWAEDFGVQAETKLIEDGHPIKAILETEAGHDLVVMGTHGRRGVDRMILGSVCEGVLRRSSVPLLVIRCPEDKDKDFDLVEHYRQSPEAN